jgi:hypothetical protein
MHLDQLAGFIVSADHSVMCATVVLCVFNSIGNFEIPQPSKWQCIRDQINAAFITGAGGLRKRARNAQCFSQRLASSRYDKSRHASHLRKQTLFPFCELRVLWP